jgi:hypothetical protein
MSSSHRKLAIPGAPTVLLSGCDQWHPQLPDQLEDAGTVPPDDLLDAAAAAWTAWRVATGKAEVLPVSERRAVTSTSEG